MIFTLSHQVDGYQYIEGMEALLLRLKVISMCGDGFIVCISELHFAFVKESGYEMHAFSNYPDWYL